MISELTYLKSVAIYCRLSKDDGTISDSSSIKSQRELLTKYNVKLSLCLDKISIF